MARTQTQILANQIAALSAEFARMQEQLEITDDALGRAYAFMLKQSVEFEDPTYKQWCERKHKEPA